VTLLNAPFKAFKVDGVAKRWTYRPPWGALFTILADGAAP
jgi:hypothetical protein